MKHEDYSELITDYLRGTLSEAGQQQFRMLVEEGRLDISEIIEMEKMYRELGTIPVPEPGNRMQQRFYAMLDQEKAALEASSTETGKPRDWLQSVINSFRSPASAWALGMLLVGLLAGDLFTPFSNRDNKIERLSSEVYQMREILMISLLENDSPVERLRAVNVSHQIPAADTRVAEALLNTLNNDTNINVRIAAVDALVERGSSAFVRQGLVSSISRQESPLVQIALADAMIELQERSAVGQFRLLLEQETMDPNVRHKLENTIIALL